MIHLQKLQSKKAILVTSFDTEEREKEKEKEREKETCEEVDIELVQRGDILKILPGSRIPADGVIVSGSSHIDESLITGESSPILHSYSLSPIVYGGTLNISSLLYIRVTAIGSYSTLNQITQLSLLAQLSKAPVQKYVDRLASIFTPIVLLLALITFFIWFTLCSTHIIPISWYYEEYGTSFSFSLLFAISVVVISCPCGLGLAVPTAVLVGTGVGARYGVLIKGGEAFEIAHRVNTVIFDKTGTLTEGKPQLTDTVLLDEEEEREREREREKELQGSVREKEGDGEREKEIGRRRLIRLAAIAEQNSDHPVARAILQAARSLSPSLSLPSLPSSAFHSSSLSFSLHDTREEREREREGTGVSCCMNEGDIIVGNRDWMMFNGFIITLETEHVLWSIETQGKTAVCVGIIHTKEREREREMVGVCGVCDEIKRETVSVVTALRSQRYEVWMMTGDNRSCAERVGEDIGIERERIVANATPKDKVNHIKTLQSQGRVVCMVGDGVNDSPSLSLSDLGVAIGAGSQVAVEAAQVVLVRSHLTDVLVTLSLSSLVFSRIQLNLLWAVLYNLLAIPVAAGVLFPWTHSQLPPQYAALSMALSSISVVTSSLSLRLYKRPELAERERERENEREYSVLSRCINVIKNIKDAIPISLPYFSPSHSGPLYSPVPLSEEEEGEEREREREEKTEKRGFEIPIWNKERRERERKREKEKDEEEEEENDLEKLI
eukprot:CAMPEP_0182421552 /NCGR_PEP_ID=MMETSP1167-20130531/6970_1 /TAXON_ID=2988 /ORGANISM="Mallomonas Sp, Strain CCMP3275" /LENGTH=724 /DNA_ID=CAMNT_0024598799 /DNA_START=477 /DNA_END=2651 /DNA_ORIENTATION=-